MTVNEECIFCLMWQSVPFIVKCALYSLVYSILVKYALLAFTTVWIYFGNYGENENEIRVLLVSC
jgi:hypothetical protein